MFKLTKKRIIIGMMILLWLFIILFYWFILKDLPNPYNLRNYKVVPISSTIRDRNGIILYEVFSEQNRTPVQISSLPKYVLQATIAIEDKDFYRHGGVSFISGIVRAIKDMALKKGLQGGSTITQQLVKSALLTPERTIRRKIKEVILAVWTEQIFTKDEILEMYMNQIPYGGSSYGIEQAAKMYFGIPASKLNLSQAAYLAGLPQAPSYYSPFTNPERAKARQKQVLKLMKELKFISEEEEKNALNQVLHIKQPTNSIKAPHFVFYVKSQLEQVFGVQEVEEGGLDVITTLDWHIQASAEAIIRDEIANLRQYNVTNGASLVTRPTTGEILAMVGSVDFFASPSGTYNVTTALRQPGSAIKPLNYAVGIDRKLVTAASLFIDAPTCYPNPAGGKPYCPVNYDGLFHGSVALRYALGNSFNIPAVKMLAINGVREFVSSTSGFLITTLKDPDKYGLSLTLGGGEVKMTELAQAFSAFANNGKPRKLSSILQVKNKRNQIVYKFKDVNFIQDVRKPMSYPNYLVIPGKRAISQETAFIISHILHDNSARSAAFGELSDLVIPNRTVSVKTGTTDDKRDNWTIGYTPNFLVVTWVGNNDNSPMNPYITSGITGASPIWNRIMRVVLENQPDLKPRTPSGVIPKYVCSNGAMAPKTGETVEGCNPRLEYFIRGTESKPFETTRKVIPVNRDTGKMTTPNDPAVEFREQTVITDGISVQCVDCAQ